LSESARERGRLCVFRNVALIPGHGAEVPCFPVEQDGQVCFRQEDERDEKGEG
jgi:hypothetical protein